MTVQEYVAMQPKFAWRRRLMRKWLIRGLGFHILWDVTVTGTENIPAKGSAIIMMNHVSLLDPGLCMGAVQHRFVIAMTKVENLKNPLTAAIIKWWGAFSVNRGEIDRKALMSSIELAKSGELILIAPEGTRHPETGLTQPKDGLVYVATKADALIIPGAVTGVLGWEKSLKSLRRHRGVRVNFGRPFKFKTDGRERVSREEMAIMTQEAMYQLAMAIPDEHKQLRGEYSDLSKATTDHLIFIDPQRYP